MPQYLHTAFLMIYLLSFVYYSLIQIKVTLCFFYTDYVCGHVAYDDKLKREAYFEKS